MKIREVKTLKGGEILSESVLTEEKEILISKGTVLKPEYLDLLLFLGVDTVSIEDPYIEFEKPHRFMEQGLFEDYVNRVKKILESHIYAGKAELQVMQLVAKDIVKDMMKANEKLVIDFEERSGNLYEHTITVTCLSLAIARRLKLNDECMENIAIGSLLHDLGLRYITVPYINYDVEKSAAAEVFELKKHPVLAYSALENESWLSESAKRMVLSHHERRDGSGFPLHQKSKEIECNVLQVSDIFDCMISGVECKRSNVQTALEYITEASGILYDKKVVKALVKIAARYPVGTKVKLNIGSNGIVVSQTEDANHPIVAVLNEDGTLSSTYHNLKKDKKVSILGIKE